MTEELRTEELRKLEERLLRPEFRRNRAAVSALLADEFVEHGSSGRVFGKQQVLDLLQSEESYLIRMTDCRVQMLSPAVALVLYRSVRPASPLQSGAAFLRSSLWVHRDGRWQMIFHQGTRMASQGDAEGAINPAVRPAVRPAGEPGEKIGERLQLRISPHAESHFIARLSRSSAASGASGRFWPRRCAGCGAVCCAPALRLHQPVAYPRTGGMVSV